MSRFVYYNIRDDKKHLNDCVTRAISLSSGLDYSIIRIKLFHTARLLDCEKLCWTCYMFFIQEVLGFRATNCDNMTVRAFAYKHPFGTYIVRIPNHLTCIINGKVYDTWDCLDMPCTIAWRKP